MNLLGQVWLVAACRKERRDRRRLLPRRRRRVQDAHAAEHGLPRLRRPAGLLCAGTPDAAHRGRTADRPGRAVSPQLHPGLAAFHHGKFSPEKHNYLLQVQVYPIRCTVVFP